MEVAFVGLRDDGREREREAGKPACGSVAWMEVDLTHSIGGGDASLRLSRSLHLGGLGRRRRGSDAVEVPVASLCTQPTKMIATHHTALHHQEYTNEQTRVCS